MYYVLDKDALSLATGSTQEDKNSADHKSVCLLTPSQKLLWMFWKQNQTDEHW